MSAMPKLGRINATIRDLPARYGAVMPIGDLYAVEPDWPPTFRDDERSSMQNY